MWCNYWINALYCMSAFEQIQHIKKAIIASIPFFCIVGIYLPHKDSAFPEHSHYLSCKKKNKSTYDFARLDIQFHVKPSNNADIIKNSTLNVPPHHPASQTVARKLKS